MSLNKVIVMGRPTKDITLSYTQSGTAVTSFTLAVQSDFKNKQTDEYPVYWIDCVAFGKTAEFIAAHMSEKGRMIAVEGRLQTQNFLDKSGNSRKITEIVVENAYFADSKREAQRIPATREIPKAPTDGTFDEINDSEGSLPF